MAGAHENGVVHRDIKPGNILLSKQGEPLVADFGIALAVAQAGGGRITETGLSLGTPHYMSPEQATGDRDVDPRSDVYALGCVLYEMLAGQPPFSASTAQAVLVKILTADAPSITTERRTVPPNVGAALAQALEKLPADRFTSAGEFGVIVYLTQRTRRYSRQYGVHDHASTVRVYARSCRDGIGEDIMGDAEAGKQLDNRWRCVVWRCVVGTEESSEVVHLTRGSHSHV